VTTAPPQEDVLKEDRTAPRLTLMPQPGPTLELPTAGDVEQLVRARGAMFLVTDRHGDVRPAGARELGLFDRDTRHLSHYALTIENGAAVHLSAEPVGDAFNQVDLMLTDLEAGEFLDDPKNYVHIRRRQLLDGGLFEEITFTNFLRRAIKLDVTIAFGCDFADIFEVRGARRPQRGTLRTPRIEGSCVVLAYHGLDDLTYETHVSFDTKPSKIDRDHAKFALSIDAGQSETIELHVSPRRGGERRTFSRSTYRRRIAHAQEDADRFREGSAKLSCDDPRLQQVIDRSIGDLHALQVHAGDHRILGAGIPWFCAPFGRDSLIAAYEALLLNPDLAADALRMLAAHQGTKFDDEREEEPGKIFHELRFGEMARAREIPHSPYYGTIDATPLFVVVLAETYKVSGDRALVSELAPALLAALEWIDRRSDEGSRFVTYERKTSKGLENQGWKDSQAGVSFPDGRRASLPIALCEVQGYCADAYAKGAELLSIQNDHERAKTYRERATRLTTLINRDLWLEKEGRYAYAVDGDGRVLDTVVSNLGHLLWSKVAPRERAASTARLLTSGPSLSTFGIRTLASDQAVYNPLSYHNGTVWPHDNALIAAGMGAYDLGDEVAKVFSGLHRAMAYFRDHRMPELFCGIGSRSGPLVRYPVACSPQAWAAAAPFLMLQTMLGIRPDAPRARLTIRNPRLPPQVRRLEIEHMRVGNVLVSMRFRRLGRRCHIDHLDVVGGALKTEIELD
jgi:glycogen debranching enzyme